MQDASIWESRALFLAHQFAKTLGTPRLQHCGKWEQQTKPPNQHQLLHAHPTPARQPDGVGGHHAERNRAFHFRKQLLPVGKPFSRVLWVIYAKLAGTWCAMSLLRRTTTSPSTICRPSDGTKTATM